MSQIRRPTRFCGSPPGNTLNVERSGVSSMSDSSMRTNPSLDGDIMFDGSSIEGFVRIEESDMLLTPDLSTFKVFPGGDPQNRVGRLICYITMPEGEPFDGDPRAALRRQVARAAKLGYTMNAGMEAE